jgi:hypothetical protein
VRVRKGSNAAVRFIDAAIKRCVGDLGSAEALQQFTDSSADDAIAVSSKRLSTRLLQCPEMFRHPLRPGLIACLPLLPTC